MAEGGSGPAEPPRRLRLTYRALFVLCTVNLVDMINATLLVPYVDAMVSHLLGVKRGDPKVASWVSIITGSYSVCEVLFSGLWGMLSDRVGRRPVLLIGLAGSIVAPVLFGLAQSLPAALAARLLDGFFCGNVGVTRTYLGELVDSSNEAWAFGMLALCFSVGIFIGPLLGGMLSEPMTWAPGVFAGTVFDSHPYLLPNLVYACFAVVAWVIGFCSLQETHPVRLLRRRSEDPRVVPLSAVEAPPPVEEAVPERPRTALSPNVLRVLVSYGLLSGYVAARLQGFVLVLSLPRTMDGFAIGPKEFGYLQVCAAVSIFLTQTFLYSRGIKRFGPYRSFRAGMWLTIILNLPFPLYGLLADPEKYGLWRFVPIGFWQGASQVGLTFCFPTLFMLINRECDQTNRGSINGFSNSIGALGRGLFPLVAGGVFSLGCQLEDHHLAGGRYLVFYVIPVIGLASNFLIAKAGRVAAAQAGAKPPLEVARTAALEAEAGPEVGG